MKSKRNKGFTLVELIIVIAILAIIMLIAIPNFSGIRQRMQVRADKASAAQICKMVRVWYTDNYATKNQSEIPDLKDGETVVLTPYSELDGIEKHISKDMIADSLLINSNPNKGAKYPGGGKYYVTVLYSGISTRFIVGIDYAPDTTGTGVLIAPTLQRPTGTVTEDIVKYDGTKPDWAFLEI